MRFNAIAPLLLIAMVMTFAVGPVVHAGKKPVGASDKPDSASAVDPTTITEKMVVEWPPEDKWTSGYHYRGESSDMQIFYPEGQSTAGWKEMATIEMTIGKTRNIAGIARETYLGTVRGSPNATWDILKKGSTENDRPFIIYEIICPDFLNEEPSQVQLWKLIIGHTALFTAQYSYRGKEMPAERREQIIKVLEKAYVKVVKKEESQP